MYSQKLVSEAAAETMIPMSKRRMLLSRVVLTLGLLVPGFDKGSQAFIFNSPAARPSCSNRAAVVGGRFASVPPMEVSGVITAERQASGLHNQRYRWQARRAIRPTAMSFEPGVEAGAVSAGGDGAPEQGFEEGMAPVDLEQAMGSFSPEWANDTARADAKEQLIKGSVISADQTIFPYSPESFPPLANSEVYYNGTSERFWWNQNSDVVSVYVPVPVGFEAEKVEFEAKTKHICLRLDGEEVLSGTPFYRIDGYDSLYFLDSDNDPPYVQLELFKVREFQNWEDLLIEASSFTPGGSQ